MSENQTDSDLNINPDTLYQKSVQELKQIAKSMGLKGVSTLKKQALAERIRAELGNDGSSDSPVESHDIQYGEQAHIQTYDNNKPSSGRKQRGKSQDNNRNQPPRKHNKKHVSNALPESEASTLDERIAEIEPQLGKFLLNEGTLEILPDGYGFLRSVNYNYKASPDDIYVSPSQIKRFRLRQL